MALGIFSLTIYLIIGALVSGYLFAFLQDVALTPGDYFKQIVESLGWLDFALLALKTMAFGFFHRHRDLLSRTGAAAAAR